MGGFVQSQVIVYWVLKLCATPWVSCTPVACMTFPDSSPFMWAPLLLLRVDWSWRLTRKNSDRALSSFCFLITICFPKVGLPAKSGVSGAVLLVVPNVMGMMCWSPPLDRLGNSVRGIHFCNVCSLKFLILNNSKAEGVAKVLLLNSFDLLPARTLCLTSASTIMTTWGISTRSTIPGDDQMMTQ